MYLLFLKKTALTGIYISHWKYIVSFYIYEILRLFEIHLLINSFVSRNIWIMGLWWWRRAEAIGAI